MLWTACSIYHHHYDQRNERAEATSTVYYWEEIFTAIPICPSQETSASISDSHRSDSFISKEIWIPELIGQLNFLSQTNSKAPTPVLCYSVYYHKVMTWRNKPAEAEKLSDNWCWNSTTPWSLWSSYLTYAYEWESKQFLKRHISLAFKYFMVSIDFWS